MIGLLIGAAIGLCAVGLVFIFAICRAAGRADQDLHRQMIRRRLGWPPLE